MSEESGTIELVESTAPSFEVSDLTPDDATVTVGAKIDVSATVENTGDEKATADVGFVMGDSDTSVRTRNTEVTLDAGESTTVSFEDVDTSGLDPGTYTHTISANPTDPGGGDPPGQSDVTQSLSTVEPAPGETVTATVEIPVDGENVAADFATKFDPDFASTELVSSELDGTPVSPDIRVVGPDAFLFASRENLSNGLLEIVYEVTVPSDAEDGDTYEWYQVAAQVDGKEMTTAGDYSLTVSAGGSGDVEIPTTARNQL